MDPPPPPFNTHMLARAHVYAYTRTRSRSRSRTVTSEFHRPVVSEPCSCQRVCPQGVATGMSLLPEQPAADAVVAGQRALSAAVQLGSRQLAELRAATERPSGALILAEAEAEGPAAAARTALLDFFEACFLVKSEVTGPEP